MHYKLIYYEIFLFEVLCKILGGLRGEKIKRLIFNTKAPQVNRKSHKGEPWNQLFQF